MARLVLLSEGLTGKTYELKVEKTTIGRVSDNSFEVAEPSISSHHCEILLKGSEVVVRDLNSTNGTFINNERVTESVLKPGQILRLGMVEMRLESGEPAPKPKEHLDHTRVIPQGVNPDELAATKPLKLEENKGFEPKSNRATKVFVLFAVLFFLCVVGVLIFLATR